MKDKARRFSVKSDTASAIFEAPVLSVSTEGHIGSKVLIMIHANAGSMAVYLSNEQAMDLVDELAWFVYGEHGQ